MFRQVAGMLLEAAGARVPKTRPPGAPEVVYDAMAGGFVTRPRPQRVQVWNQHDQEFQTVEAVWDERQQAWMPVHAACTPAAVAGPSGRSSDWSPDAEARRFLEHTPTKAPEST